MNIRLAKKTDLDAITHIYNQAVESTTATFDTEPKTLAEQEIWLSHHNEQYPVWVLEVDSTIVGWLSISQWSDRCAYSETGEISVFVREDSQGKGFGKALLKYAIEEAPRAGLHTLVARISEGNAISFKLHEDLGFFHIGTMKEVGRKFGKRLDVRLYQLMLEK